MHGLAASRTAKAGEGRNCTLWILPRCVYWYKLHSRRTCQLDTAHIIGCFMF